MRLRHSLLLASISALAVCGCCLPLTAQFTQQGGALTGAPTLPNDQFGSAVAISADGNTAAVTTVGNGSSTEASLFIFVRVNGVWTQQGGKLVGSNQTTPSGEPNSAVAISADGNTVIFSDTTDNGEKGKTWVFTRTGTTWTEQASLTGVSTSQVQDQGASLALSADGNTAVIGSPTSNSFKGRFFVFVRSGSTWTQQASLTASGLTAAALQGHAVALSSDGNTVIVGLPADNNNAGSLVVFTRNGTTWTQQGARLAPSDATDMSSFGRAIAISADGNTAVVGGSGDHSNTGAVWIFTRSNGVWTQQGSKIVPPDASFSTDAGWSVAISSDGNTIVFGGPFGGLVAGGVWVYSRNSNTWTQQGSILLGTGATAQSCQGSSVAISGDGSTLIEGGPCNNNSTGAAWVYTKHTCTITLGGGGFNFPAAGGTNTLSVVAPSGCTWNASSNVPWLAITSGASGSGNGVVTYTASANGGAPRVGAAAGMISVTGATPPSVTITQDGGCSVVSINPTTQAIPAGGATSPSVAVTLSDSSCSMSASSNQPWISITHTGTTTIYSVQKNFQTSSSSSPRQGTISIGISGQTSGIKTLTVNQDGSSPIDGVEVTQAIQVYQRISDLEASLLATGEPPVPIIAGKQAVMRIMMKPTLEVQQSSVLVSGAVTGSQGIALQPHCTPNGLTSSQRRRDNGCRSMDFYFKPPTGAWTATVQLLDRAGAVLETHVLNFKSRITNSIQVKGVAVCNQLDASKRLICTSPSTVDTLLSNMRKIYPSASFSSGSTSNAIVVFQGTLSDLSFYQAMAKQTSALFPQNSDAFPQGSDGVHRVYAGIVSPAVENTVAGMAAAIPSNGFVVTAPSNTKYIDLPEEDAAHELGHTLGLHHTGIVVPAINTSNIGCWSNTGDPGFLWPYADNLLRSGSAPGTLEIGFDVEEDAPKPPETNFDVMAYCLNRWITPFSYIRAMSALNESAPGASSAPAPRTNALTSGSFWTVAGSVNGNTVDLSPVFTITAQADPGAGTGTWQIVVQNGSGATLYTRNFTPALAHAEGVAGSNSLSAPPSFYELIPVTAGASRIVILNDTAAQVASISVGGAAPAPTITTPLNGMMTGPLTLAWSIIDPDSTTFSSRIFYTNDNGATWQKIGETSDTTLPVDFDNLPGANTNSSRIRIDVSDGANTGSITSGAFTVPRKAPHAPNILAPKPNAFYAANTLVTLNASIFDVDDGLLDGPSVKWSSNLDGNLGTGALLYTTTLQQGTHTITVKGTDSDGNSVTGTVQITIAGAPPTLNLTFAGLNNNPVSCVQATIAATPGSVPLASAMYSFDGGMTFASVPVGELPATIGVPGSGPIHFIAQVTDMGNQVAASDATFTIASACSAAAALASAQPLSFHAAQNGPAPAAQSLNVTATGAAVAFATSAVSSGWLSVTQPAGPTPQTVSVSVNPAGLTAGPYTGSIILTPLNGGAMVSVTVNLTVGAPCSFTFTPPSAAPTAAGGPATVTVTASDPSCTWTATPNANWLTVTSGASGTGNGTVGYTADANNSVTARSSSLTIAGQTFAVNEAGATPAYSLGANSTSVGPGANNGLSIAVNASPADAAWTAVSNAPWITVTLGATGTGSGAVLYSVAANSSVNQRVGTITVAGLTFTVMQAGAGATFMLNPTSANVAATASTGTFSVTATPADASWTATPDVSWITITSGASGSGNGSVGYSVAASTSINPRTGKISVGGQAFTITQAPVTASFTLSAQSASAPAAGGPGSVNITANATDAPWTAASNATWITITAGASGTGNGSVTYSTAANTSVNSRTGTLTIAGQTFTITQAGAGTTFTLGATSANATAAGGPGSVTVTASPSDAAWTAVSNVPFIIITSGANGTGNGAVSYAVAANPSVNSRSGTLTIAGQTFTVTQAGALGTFTLGATSTNATATGGTGSVTVTATPADATWTAVSNVPWITITSGATGTGSGAVNYSVAANATTAQRVGTLTIAGQSFTITQAAPSASSGLAFYPVTPCRIADTRGGFPDPFGAPRMGGGSTRVFPVTQSACNIPANAQAYSLNVTVVPPGPLTYLSIWPTGQPQPVVSTLNSFDGRIVANAAIVPSGSNGAISVFVSDATDVIIDINGYFAPATMPNNLSFYSVTPCRVVDTRNPNGPLGGPLMTGGSIRSFPIPSSSCGVPSSAAAYSFNVTVVPRRPLGYLTTWPTGQAQPVVSTLNSVDGSIVANAAIVPAGTNGAVSFFVTDDTDVIIDINGYFGPPGSPAAQSLYTVTPCRVADTRTSSGLSGGGSRSFAIPAGPCSGIPNTAQAYSLNVTVVPSGPLSYLTAWPTGQTQPVVSTLNSPAGKVVANAAIVPAGTNGSVTVFVTNATDLILDINAYFAP